MEKTLIYSMYCKICKLHDTCDATKTCSCEKFITDEDLTCHHKPNN